MPISKYCMYRCIKCGYKFIKIRNDVALPVNCPKCTSTTELLKCKRYLSIIDFFQLFMMNIRNVYIKLKGLK